MTIQSANREVCRFFRKEPRPPLNYLLDKTDYPIFRQIFSNLHYLQVLKLLYVSKRFSEDTIIYFQEKAISDLQILSSQTKSEKFLFLEEAKAQVKLLKNTLRIHKFCVDFAVGGLSIFNTINKTQDNQQQLVAELADTILQIENPLTAWALMNILIDPTARTYLSNHPDQVQKMRTGILKQMIQEDAVETALMYANRLKANLMDNQRSWALGAIFSLLLEKNEAGDYDKLFNLIPQLICNEDKLGLLHCVMLDLCENPQSDQSCSLTLLKIMVQLGKMDLSKEWGFSTDRFIDRNICWYVLKTLSQMRCPDFFVTQAVLNRIQLYQHDRMLPNYYKDHQHHTDILNALSNLERKIETPYWASDLEVRNRLNELIIKFKQELPSSSFFSIGLPDF